MKEKKDIKPLKGNKGEWSEIYIFLKLMEDGKIYAADHDMKRIKNVFLNILKIIREEYKGEVYEYFTGKEIEIHLNNECVYIADKELFSDNRKYIWKTIKNSKGGIIECPESNEFLNSIYITKLKSPATSQNGFFGGTQDITMQTQDHRSGVTSVTGFSCKSDFAGKATLFNASNDNTNFVYEVTGNINDTVMNEFNNIFDSKKHVATGKRMKYLKKKHCDIRYINTAKPNAKRNLILSGGMELPLITGEMLKYYYYIHNGEAAYSSIKNALSYITDTDVAKYNCDDLSSLYSRKIGSLLYDMFTGMRLSKPWNGRSSVNGGYIVVKPDGDVLAYHTCITDEFKDFLVSRLRFESPSAKRHEYMSIYKENDKYYLKLSLQIRFNK